MLEIYVPLSLSFNEETSEFIVDSTYKLELEHSLVSLSKWESHFEKPFLSDGEKTAEETLYYIRNCMTLTKDVSDEVFECLSKENYSDIQKYIVAKRTATWFNRPPNQPRSRQIITSAVIYAMMVALKIPFETQHWHLNELFTLIEVCNEQNKPPKKMNRSDVIRQRNRLNAERKARMGHGG